MQVNVFYYYFTAAAAGCLEIYELYVRDHEERLQGISVFSESAKPLRRTF